MGIRAFKYLSVLSIPLAVFFSFTGTGMICFLPLIYAFVIIPLLELTLGKNANNLNQVQEDLARSNKLYDFVLYSIVPIHFGFLFWFFYAIQEPDLSFIDQIGRTSAMGLLCGLFGINVAHELGHRATKWEQGMSKLLLLSTQYTHFFIEHNEGHHKNVCTPEDPATAKLNENVYAFYLRSIFLSYRSAWMIEMKRLKRKKKSSFSLENRMIQMSLTQVLFCAVVVLVFGWMVLMWYLLAALFGILLLETINYIEHYGLSRIKVSEFRYEDAGVQHSWNSDHTLGRLMLYELSRHSDHHAHPNRKYQILRHHDDSPQMPTGYPGMMVIAAFPPLWFAIINPKIKALSK